MEGERSRKIAPHAVSDVTRSSSIKPRNLSNFPSLMPPRLDENLELECRNVFRFVPLQCYPEMEDRAYA